ncbi:lysis system i-spanin subunit Rz [Pseudomonas fluorescens]|uniref:lysis system i-spanin subunit Rz n=1 Tax=Pseudomonas fluorescens TaxID=294 RepID=UPI001CA737C2|nr:lysis system i-spanin subunit Rz [Pseudomonas fluorescens]MBY8934226.1 lysis protein [Pseudomonas fluorescens]
MKILAGICAVLIVGLLLALWRLDHVSASLTRAESAISELEAVAASRRNTQRLLLDLDTKRTQELSDAQAHNNQLRAAVATGARRLSVKAACPAVRTTTTSASVGDAEARAELDPASAARIVATANDGDEAIIALSALQDYVSTACIPRK